MVFQACKSVNHYQSKPSKNAGFGGDKSLPELDLAVYHLNDSITRVNYKLDAEPLMYRREDTTQIFYANVQLACKLIPEINSRQIIDSTSVYLRIRYPETKEAMLKEGSFLLKVKTLSYAYLEFTVNDRNKSQKHLYHLAIDKKNTAVAQNFEIRNTSGLCYKTNFYPGEEISLYSVRNPGAKALAECFYKEFPPAMPPFSAQKPDELKFKPDSSYLLDLNTAKLIIPQKGFLHVRAKTDSHDGLSLFSFEKSYPGVSDIEEMIKCTRYIMSKDEYLKCKEAADQKQCIDQFWLGLAGSNERAKELLKKYYNRVKEANKRYTSYTQGWKSDRGMIYIVFGEPVNIYRSRNDEIWIYGSEVDVNALKFIFKHSDNPYSDNDFILQRSHLYKEPWYTAVDFWRQGRLSLEK